MYARYALQCTLLRKAFQSNVERIPVIRMLRMFPFWKQQMCPGPGGPRMFQSLVPNHLDILLKWVKRFITFWEKNIILKSNVKSVRLFSFDDNISLGFPKQSRY